MLWLLQTVFCFWEKRSMNIMIRKNLTAHKKRNNLTAIIYSLTLGTVIFMLMQLRLEFSLLTYIHSISDATFALEASPETSSSKAPNLNPLIVQPILSAHENEIDEWAYITPKLYEEIRNTATDWSENIAD